MVMKPNPGQCPRNAKGKRVRVQFPDGRIGKDAGSATSPGWAADTTNWTLPVGDPIADKFRVAFYEIL